MKYGPRTPEVEECLKQIRHLDRAQIDYLAAISRAHEDHLLVPDELWDELWEVGGASGRYGVMEEAKSDAWTALGSHRGSVDEWTQAWYAVCHAIVFETVADICSQERWQQLTVPWNLVIEPPPWWSDTGSRQLFFEQIEQGVSISEARQVAGLL